jgi:hypothetical protein
LRFGIWLGDLATLSFSDKSLATYYVRRPQIFREAELRLRFSVFEMVEKEFFGGHKRTLNYSKAGIG